MSTTHIRAKRLLVTAIGAAVLGISLAAAPAAIAEKNAPNPPGNHIPLPPGGLQPPPPPPPPPHYVVIPPPGKYVLPPNKTQSGWK
jgi:hypothetical protein